MSHLWIEVKMCILDDTLSFMGIYHGIMQTLRRCFPLVLLRFLFLTLDRLKDSNELYSDSISHVSVRMPIP
jgi:hypothetical protein